MYNIHLIYYTLFQMCNSAARVAKENRFETVGIEIHCIFVMLSVGA